MKICKLNWYGHPVLGDFSLNLTKTDGTPYDTVIFAGENGSGKTVILNSLFDYFNQHPIGNISFGAKNNGVQLALEVVFDENDIIIDKTENRVFNAKITLNEIEGKVNTQFFNNGGSSVQVGNIPQSVARAIYSQIAINYNSGNITATTNSELDKINNRSEKSSDNLATEIKQLFLDIHRDDSSELSQWVDANQGIVVPQDVQHKRISRFRNAFKNVFKNKLIFKGVMGLNVLFEKNGVEVPIDQLSSGEKQIVFRGGFLLRNQGVIGGATVLLDEPELSMHPKWQERILGFYQTLFTDESNTQTSQIFIATHSDHILKNALENDNTLIIMLKDGSAPEYIHKNNRGMALKTTTLAEVKWRIFDLPTTDFHDQLWAELSYDDLTGDVKNVKNLDTELANIINGDSSKLKAWTGYQADSTQPSGRRTNRGNDTKSLPTYIRNYTHHPEFTDINNVTDNIAYTEDDLRNSIEFMISVVLQI